MGFKNLPVSDSLQSPIVCMKDIDFSADTCSFSPRGGESVKSAMQNGNAAPFEIKGIHCHQSNNTLRFLLQHRQPPANSISTF